MAGKMKNRIGEKHGKLTVNITCKIWKRMEYRKNVRDSNNKNSKKRWWWAMEVKLRDYQQDVYDRTLLEFKKKNVKGVCVVLPCR